MCRCPTKSGFQTSSSAYEAPCGQSPGRIGFALQVETAASWTELALFIGKEQDCIYPVALSPT
jgi:hypothetical protein